MQYNTQHINITQHNKIDHYSTVHHLNMSPGQMDLVSFTCCLGAVATTPNTWSRPIGSTVPLSWCPPSLTTPTRHIQSEPPSLSFTNLSRLFQWSYTPSPSQNCKANVPSTWDSGQTAKQLLQLQIDNEMQLLMISAPKKQRTHRFMSSKCGHTARRQQFDQQTETFLLLPDLKAPAAQISC